MHLDVSTTGPGARARVFTMRHGSGPSCPGDDVGGCFVTELSAITLCGIRGQRIHKARVAMEVGQPLIYM